MSDEIKVLIAGHKPADLELIQHQLIGAGLRCIAEFAQTEKAYIKAINSFVPDIILSFYNLPKLQGTIAFALREQLAPATPLIFISEATNEEQFIELIWTGLTDYVLADKMFTLGPKVIRALKEAKEKKQKNIIETKLAESEARFAEAQAMCKIGSWETDLSDRTAIWSAEMYRIFEVDPDIFQPSQHGFFQFVHPEDLERVISTYTNSNESVSRNWIEHRILTSCGTLKHLEGSWKILKDEQGIPVKAFGTCQDITERSKAEEINKFEKRDKEALINSTDDLLWSVDSDLKLVAANNPFYDRMKAATGVMLVPGDYLLMTDHYSKEYLALWKKCYERALLGNSFKEEIYVPTFNKVEASWTETGFTPIVNNGVVEGIACYLRNITEKKLGEEKARQREAHLAEAQRVAKMGSWDFDLELDKVSWSEEIYNVFGIDKQVPAIRDSYIKLIDAEGRQLVDLTSSKTRQTGDAYTIEYNITTHNGESRVIREHGYGKKNEEGKVTHLFGTAQDITESKKAVAAIKKAYEEKNMVLERIDDGFFAIDNDSLVTYWNKKAEILLNINRADIIGKNLHEIFARPNSMVFYNNYKKAISENRTVHFEGFSERSKKWFAVSAFPSDNGLSVYFKDVTEQKNDEEKLRESELRYRLLIEQATDTICMVDSSMKFIEVNPSGCRMFGYSKEEFLHLYVSDVLFEDELKSKPIPIDDLKAGKTTSNEREIKRKDGTSLEVEISGKMLEDGRIMIFGRDISERKKAERLIKESEAKYRSFFESSMDGILLAVANGTILAANPAACEIFKMTEEEIRATDRMELVDVTDPRVHRLIKERQRTGRVKGEVTLLRKDGIKFQAELTSVMFSHTYGEEKISLIIRDITERKQAEEQLTATSNNLQTALNDINKIMDSSLDVICAVDAQGYFLKVSAAAEAVWGYKPHELVGKSILNLVFPEDHDITLASANRVMSGTNNTHFQNRYVRKDGTLVPIEWSARWDEKDRIRYGVARDVTDKKKLQQAFEAERKRLHDLFSHAPTSMGVLKGENHVVEITNPLFLALIGKVNIIGKPITAILPEIVSQGLIQILDDVYNTGNTFSAYEKLVQLNISEDGILVDKYWNFIFQAYRNIENKIEGVFFFIIDVTEQLVSRKKIEQSEKRYRQIVETAQEGIWLVDAANKTTFVNTKMCEILEYTQEEMIGQEIYAFMDEEGKVLAKHLKLNKKEEHSSHNYFKYISKSGKEVWANLSANPLFNEDGSYKGNLAMVTDVTERKKAEIHLKELNENLERQTRELAVSNSELEQFAYVASHDLQEPLRMVSSFLTQLEKKYGETIDHTGKKYIYFAVDGAKRMRQIIEDLLEFSRAGRSYDEVENINLNDLLAEIQILFRQQIEEKKALIIVDQLPSVQVHRSPMRQVFQNLVSNALKYSGNDRSAKIHISAVEFEEHWQFAVADNGIGIEKHYFDKIFIIFQRLHTKEEFSGTGLGLAITKKIIEHKGGRIWLESEEGKGSTFYFTIPKNEK
ncbi:MAG: PAS domain S-box protein [Ferruginibacter sp.]